MCKRTLSQKSGVFIVLSLLQNQNKKIQHTILETFIKKGSMQNVKLEILTTIFFKKKLLLELFFFKYCRAIFLKTKKKLKIDTSYQKIALHNKKQKKNPEKQKEKRKMRKSQTKTNIFLLFLFYIEKFIFC